MSMDKEETRTLRSMVKHFQGLPISLTPNEPFHLTLSDLLWVDPEQTSSQVQHHSKNEALPSKGVENGLEDLHSNPSLPSEPTETAYFFFHGDYTEYSLHPAFIPSPPIELDPSVSPGPCIDLNPVSPNTDQSIDPATPSELQPLPAIPPLQSPDSPALQDSELLLTTSLNLPAPTMITTTMAPSTSTLHDPRLVIRPQTSNIPKPQTVKCPSPPTSSNGSSTPKASPEILSNSAFYSRMEALILPMSVQNTLNSRRFLQTDSSSAASLTTSSSKNFCPTINHVFSVYRQDANPFDDLTITKDSTALYTKLTRDEHKEYIFLEKKKKHSALNEIERSLFERLHTLVLKEQAEYTNYINGFLFQASARYLAIDETVQDRMMNFLRHQQKRRALYPPVYVSKTAWKPLTLHPDLKTTPINFQRLKVHSEVMHAPVSLEMFKTMNLPLDFRPDFAKCLPPLSKDSVMAELIPQLPGIQLMMTSGTLSKLARVAHDFHTTERSKLDLLFPVTIHKRVVCIDKPLLNSNCIPRDIMQKYFQLALRGLGSKHAPQAFQFATYQMGPFQLLIRTQLDAPEQRIKCNVEYVAELGMEQLDPSLLAAYSMKESLNQHVKVARVHLTSGKILDVTKPAPVPLYLPCVLEVFQYLTTLSDGFYLIATRPDDIYLYILEQPHDSSNTGHLDIRPAHVQIKLTPSIRMLTWKEKPDQIPYTFDFPPFKSVRHQPQYYKRPHQGQPTPQNPQYKKSHQNFHQKNASNTFQAPRTFHPPGKKRKWNPRKKKQGNAQYPTSTD